MMVEILQRSFRIVMETQLTRQEYDSIGTLEVPADAYYGVQTLRAFHNFPMTGRRMHPRLIKNIALVKKAAAETNRRAGLLPKALANAIDRACDEIIAGGLRDAFIVDPIQGGAGTSANMNANEVIANRAIELLGGPKGAYHMVHPNDHVNMAQSTNDVYPSAGKLALIGLIAQARRAVESLRDAFVDKAAAFDGVVKMGRTQLQDAVPMRLGQGFHAYAAALNRDLARLDMAREGLLVLNLGGTAIGTTVTASPYYVRNVVRILADISGLPVRQAEDLFDATQNLDCFAAASGALKTCALSMSKIANDLRLLSSGPRTGLGEISLPPMQNGSSIMPGKVNPVIPEVVTQAAYRIAGNDVTVSMCVESGQLELNAFEPVLLDSLFESADLLRNAAHTFRVHCVEGIEANAEHCARQVRESYGVVTALCPVIGYEQAAAMVKGSMQDEVPILEYVEKHLSLPKETVEGMTDAYAMTGPAREDAFAVGQ